MNIKSENIKIAAVRYYDVENNGLVYPNDEQLSYVVLLNRGDVYINLLNPEESLPVFKRVPYTTNYHGTEVCFGTKVRLESGEDKEGEVWLVEPHLTFSEYPMDVSIRDVEDYVIESPIYFVDRARVIEERLKRKIMTPHRRKKLINIMLSDKEKESKVKAFFDDCHGKKVMTK